MNSRVNLLGILAKYNPSRTYSDLQYFNNKFQKILK